MFVVIFFILNCIHSNYYEKFNAGVLNQFSKITDNLGLLEKNEQLSGVAESDVKAWQYVTQYQLAGMLRRWNATKPELIGVTYYDRLGELLLDIATDRLQAIELNCFRVAFDAFYFNFNMSLNEPYYFSLDVPTWEQKFDLGSYKQKINFEFDFDTNDALLGDKHHHVVYVADSIMRVDIEPTEWYTKALPFLMKNSKSEGKFGCKKNELIKDCYFGDHGLWTAITSGFYVISNCQINVTTTDMKGQYNSSSSTTCQKDEPYISAWVIKKIPVRDSFCPCYNNDHKITQFCTSPPNQGMEDVKERQNQKRIKIRIK